MQSVQTSDIMRYFPLKEPRKAQVTALQFVEDAISKGFRDIVIEAPTGVGKSAIACTIAAWSKKHVALDAVNFKPGSFVLVHQKVLQDQLEAELDRLAGTEKAALIKSSVEYPCQAFKRCSVGLVDHRCDQPAAGACAYRNAKRRFIDATVAVTNYAYFFTERLFSGKIPPRQGLVLDESHGLAKVILGFVGVKIAEASLDKFAPDIDAKALRDIASMADLSAWMVSDYIPAVHAQAELMASLSDGDEKIAKEAHDVMQHYLRIADFGEKKDKSDWIFWKEDDKDGKATLNAKPLHVGPYFSELVEAAAPFRVYMSAYLGPKAVFCREIGLDPKRVAWLRLGSPFEPSKRKVYLLDIGSMARKSQEATLPAMLRTVAKIVTQFNARGAPRGIIHTQSYVLADKIHAALAGNFGPRLVYPRNADEREDALKRAAAAEGSILISPSVGEGFDFRGDLARWQIICKAPWASLGDKHTAAMADRDPDWYRNEAVKGFIQMCGRICRSEDDHGVTYVLDTDARRLVERSRDELPRWFRVALLNPDGSAIFTEQ